MKDFHASEIFFRIIIIVFLVLILLLVKRNEKINNNVALKYYVIAFWLLLLQHSSMFLIRFGEVFMGITPPEPYFPIFDHAIETAFFIYLLFASIAVSLPEIRKGLIKLLLSASLIIFAILTVIIFYSYVNSYELGVEFGNHWGDLVFESWHLVIIEGLTFIFAFMYLARKEKKDLLFLLAMIPWIVGHTGHTLNLAIADNSFIPLRWIEWPFLTVGIIILFFAFMSLLKKLKEENE